MIIKTEFAIYEHCPLCGGEVRVEKVYRGFPPEENLYDNKNWFFQVRFAAKCQSCFLQQDVVKQFPAEDQACGKATVKEFFPKFENFWNRRNKDESN